MPVKITVNTVGKLAALPLSDESLMTEVGQLAIRRIHSRTSAGKDVDGAPFQPLSGGYAKARTKQGLGTTSNLTLSGAMLNAMTIAEVGPRKVSIGFATGGGRGASRGTLIQKSRSAGANFKATMHMGDGRVERKFFALSDEDETAITAAVDRFIGQYFR